MLVGDAIDLWLRGELKYRRPASRTWERCRASLSGHIRRTIGDETVSNLAPGHVWHLQRELHGEGGLSVETVNKITHAVLFAMLADLEANGLADPAVRQRLRLARPLRLQTSARCKHYGVEQRDACLAAFARLAPKCLPLAAFLFHTGVRRGEAAGLQQADFDWKYRVFYVERSRNEFGEVTPCKTARSQRMVPLTDFLYPLLQPLRRDAEPGAWFFPGDRGAVMNPDSFARNTWARVLRAAGLPKLLLHGTRHSWATIAIESGMPPIEVARQMGDTLDMVLARYVHVTPRFDPNAAVTGIPTALEVAEGRRVFPPYLRVIK